MSLCVLLLVMLCRMADCSVDSDVSSVVTSTNELPHQTSRELSHVALDTSLYASVRRVTVLGSPRSRNLNVSGSKRGGSAENTDEIS